MTPAPAAERKKWGAYRTTLTPKNGKFLVVLLAGGPADRARELQEAFAERRGMLVKYHWPYHQTRAWQRAVPSDVDVVVFLKTMAGHSEQAHIKNAAKKADVPLLKTGHKWTTIAISLNSRFGLMKAPALPLNVKSATYLREADVEEEAAPANLVLVPPAAPTAQQAPLPPATPSEEQQLMAIRRTLAEKDTLSLVRELQVRLAGIAPDATCLITTTEVTFDTRKP